MYNVNRPTEEYIDMKHTLITVPLYGAEIHFFITNKPEEIFQCLKKDGLELTREDKQDFLAKDTSGLACETFKDGEVESYLLWLPRFNSTPTDWNTLSHEITHLKNYIWEYIGLKDGVATKFDEVEAYLIGWLTEEFVKFARR